jgi:conjugative transposon TraM protein
MQNNNSAQQKRQRKALLFLPVVAIPILCCSFYALGGGGGTGGNVAASKNNEHFNAQLPDAHFNKRDALVDKLGFYEKADEDSVKREMRVKADPYHSKEAKAPATTTKGEIAVGKFNAAAAAPHRQDTAADRLLEKLDQLKKIVNAPAMTARVDTGRPSFDQTTTNAVQMNRLEGMMKTIQNNATEDPQIERLNGMLDKIIRIQHLDPVSDGKSRQSDITAVDSPVMMQARPEMGSVYNIDSLERTGYTAETSVTGFQNIDADIVPSNVSGTVIPAIIPEDQTMVTGATLKLRTQQEASVGGLTIPKNALLYGKVSISGERMLVGIGSVRIGKGIYPVDLQVFDMDGMAGIRIPGAIDRDVAKESAEQGASSLGTLGTLDQSLGAQAATAGVQAAKTLFSRKVKLIRAQVRTGYLVLIKSVKNK